MSDDTSNPRDEIVDLQMKFAFQEDTIAQLNEVVTRQQVQIDRLLSAVETLQRQVLEMPTGESAATDPHPRTTDKE